MKKYILKKFKTKVELQRHLSCLIKEEYKKTKLKNCLTITLKNYKKKSKLKFTEFLLKDKKIIEIQFKKLTLAKINFNNKNGLLKSIFLVTQNKNEIYRISLGSYEITNLLELYTYIKENDIISYNDICNNRSYHLDVYFPDNNHETIKMFSGEPSYKLVKELVKGIILGTINGESSTTIKKNPLTKVKDAKLCVFDKGEYKSIEDKNERRKKIKKLKNYAKKNKNNFSKMLGVKPPKESIIQYVTGSIRKCANCKKVSKFDGDNKKEKLKRCSKCKIVYYCTRDCQFLHWKIHKKKCKLNY